MAPANLRAALRLMHDVGHPVRAEVLVAFVEDGGMMSPRYYLRLLEEADVEGRPSLGVLSYHFRVLEREKLIRPVTTRSRRGAVEHFYRITEKGRKAIYRAEAVL